MGKTLWKGLEGKAETGGLKGKGPTADRAISLGNDAMEKKTKRGRGKELGGDLRSQ